MKPLFPRFEAWAADNAGLFVTTYWLMMGLLLGLTMSSSVATSRRIADVEARVSALEACE